MRLGFVMDVPSDGKPIKVFENSAAGILRPLRDEIISEWEKRVRAEIPKASKLKHPVIINTVPTFVDNIIQALTETHSRAFATDSTTIGYEHGGERARLSQYGPDQLMREYHILRDIIYQKASAGYKLTEHEDSVIQKSFDQALQEAMMAFFLVHSKIREQFVVGLSHDLRNPLGAAKMAGEIIISVASEIENIEVREDIKGLAQRIINNTRRADRMIQDLLDATVLQTGERLPLRLEECDMLSIVRDVVINLPEKEQRRVLLSGVSVHGCWDGDGLRRAIENLVSNAFKYGASEGKVTIKISSEHERVFVIVHNEGGHIPAEDQETLFKAYKRSQSAKASGKKGWGIGLALVRGISEAHGGSIGVDSSIEEGTTFMLDIPRDAKPFQNSPITG
jgi:signal transduction histidine kinase